MDMTPANLGQWLLARAHEHGLTSEQTADILGVPPQELRRLTSADLAELPLANIADLARLLCLEWPAWLTQAPPPAPHQATGPDAYTSGTVRDANRLHALLALAIGARLSIDQIAGVLDWPIARVHAAAARLIPRMRGRQGLRLLAHADVLQLTASPGLINRQERQRLADLLQARHGHTSAAAFVVYRALHLKDAKLTEVFAHLPDILDHAVRAGLITYDLDDDRPTNITITPKVASSIGKTNHLPTPPPT